MASMLVGGAMAVMKYLRKNSCAVNVAGLQGSLHGEGQIYAVGERLDCAARTARAGSDTNTVRSAYRLNCGSGATATVRRDDNRGGTAPTVQSEQYWVEPPPTPMGDWVNFFKPILNVEQIHRGVRPMPLDLFRRPCRSGLPLLKKTNYTTADRRKKKTNPAAAGLVDRLS